LHLFFSDYREVGMVLLLLVQHHRQSQSGLSLAQVANALLLGGTTVIDMLASIQEKR
jgi:hypothetical protein